MIKFYHFLTPFFNVWLRWKMRGWKMGEGKRKRKWNGVDVVFFLGPLFLALSKLGRKWWGKWPWGGNYKKSTSIFHHSTYNNNGIVIIYFQFFHFSILFPKHAWWKLQLFFIHPKFSILQINQSLSFLDIWYIKHLYQILWPLLVISLFIKLAKMQTL